MDGVQGNLYAQFENLILADLSEAKEEKKAQSNIEERMALLFEQNKKMMENFQKVSENLNGRVAELEKKDKEIEAFKKQIGGFEECITELTEQIKNLSDQREEQKGIIANQLNTIEEKENEKIRLNEDLAKKEEELAEVRKEKERLLAGRGGNIPDGNDSEIRSPRKTIEKKESELAEVRAELLKLRGEQEPTNTVAKDEEIKSLNGKLSEKVLSEQELLLTIGEKEKELAEVRAELLKLKGEKEPTNKENKNEKLQRDLSTANEHNKKVRTILGIDPAGKEIENGNAEEECTVIRELQSAALISNRQKIIEIGLKLGMIQENQIPDLTAEDLENILTEADKVIQNGSLPNKITCHSADVEKDGTAADKAKNAKGPKGLSTVIKKVGIGAGLGGAVGGLLALLPLGIPGVNAIAIGAGAGGLAVGVRKLVKRIWSYFFPK